MSAVSNSCAHLESRVGRRIGGLLAMLVLPACLAGCGDNVRLPTPEERNAFEATGSIAPTVDMERVKKAKLHTGPYRVVPGDVLEFTMPALLRSVTEAEVRAAQVQNGRDYPFICRVSDEGTITLPAAGELDVSGKSLAQVEVSVIEAYEPYAVGRPSIYARVLEYRTAKVYVAGAVQAPGVYTLRADQMTLVSLLTEAGGISAAGAAVVRVIGSDVQEDAPEGAVQRLQSQASSGTIPAPSSPAKAPVRSVRTGLSVPLWTSVHMAARPPTAARARSQEIGGSAAAPDEPTKPTVIEPAAAGVSHSGDPSRPDPEPIASADTPVPDETPGPEERAENRPVVLPVVGMNIPFKDIALAEGDTVVVEPVQMPMMSVLGLVRNPGNFEYPLHARYNLAQAIALAGGLEMDVAPRYATVYRLKPDGTILRLTFRLIEDDQYTENVNVPIRPGDLVVVEQTPRTRTNAFLNNVFRINTGLYVRGEDLWE